VKLKLLTVSIIALFVVSAFSFIPSTVLLHTQGTQTTPTAGDETPIGWEDLTPDIQAKVSEMFAPTVQTMPSDQDLGQVLGDRVNDYKLNYEPWRSKAAIHAIAYDEGTGFLAMGGGYLYDNQIHILLIQTSTTSSRLLLDAPMGLCMSLNSDICTIPTPTLRTNLTMSGHLPTCSESSP
jgi:hypothetical protein